jgi:ABC-type transport system involved in cytochrome c biogenesis permease subunit
MLLIDIINILLPLLYGLIITVYGVLFFGKSENKNSSLLKYRKPLLLFIIGVHAAYFILRIGIYGHAPITNIYEILTLLAFSITLGYLFIEMRTKIAGTGFFILFIAGIMQLISSIFIEELTYINPVLRNNILGFHVAFVLIGYSSITLSGIFGLLYLLLYRAIKYNEYGSFYKRLPSLQMLEELTHNSLVFGYIFLSLTIVIGVFWLPHSVPDFSYSDPKLIATFSIWILYGIGYFFRKYGNFQSKTVMKLAFAGFLLTMLSIAFVNIFLSSFHKFN